MFRTLIAALEALPLPVCSRIVLSPFLPLTLQARNAPTLELLTPTRKYGFLELSAMRDKDGNKYFIYY